MLDTYIKWKRITAFNDEFFPGWKDNWEPIFGSNALAGEAGEVCNAVKKMYGGGTNKETVFEWDVVEECIDVYIYMILLCEVLGYGPEKFEVVFDYKMMELRQRMTVVDEQS